NCGVSFTEDIPKKLQTCCSSSSIELDLIFFLVLVLLQLNKLTKYAIYQEHQYGSVITMNLLFAVKMI
ncbi:hypothetical protein NWP18_05970, partial [Chrysosporum ovalisporum ANA283AFssAo]|uniref:hypothetical protein n=1 Tax=Umezakia ovalisporum TaxID=75695 RepID=UPI002475C9F3